MLQFGTTNSNVTIVRVFAKKINNQSQPSTLSSQSSRSSSAFLADWTDGFTDEDGTIIGAEVTCKKSQYQMWLMMWQRNLNCTHYM